MTTKTTIHGPELEALAEALATRVLAAMAAQPKVLLSQAEAAKILRVGRTRTLAPLIRAKKIRSVRVNGTVRIPFSEIERVQREGLLAPKVRATRIPEDVLFRPDLKTELARARLL